MDLEALVAVLEERCAELAVEVCDAELLRGGAGGRGASVLRVTVDGESGPLDLDAVAAASALVSQVLDENEALAPAGRYDLEVTSPGLERRLRRPSHFRRATGRRVALTARLDAGGERRVEGDLLSTDEEGITLAVDGGSRHLSYDEIEQAQTVFDWRAALAGDRRKEGAHTL